MLFGLSKSGLLEQADRYRGVDARVARVAAKRLLPIRFGLAIRCVKLLDALAGKEEFFYRLNIFGRGRVLDWFGHFRWLEMDRRVGDEFFAVDQERSSQIHLLYRPAAAGGV